MKDTSRLSVPFAPLSRRGFIASAAGAVLLSACGSDTATRSAGVTTAAGTFVEPEVRRSVDGVLDITLVAARATYSGAIDGALAYNDSAVGPTLRVRPGDRIELTLVNDLEAPTNLHTHGLAISPGGKADDVFATIEAGGKRSYVYEIPSDHRSGTFWYHPHLHGIVAAQVAAGLFGVIIVDDEIDDRADMQALPERLLVLNDPVGVDRGVSAMDGMHGRAGGAVRVNGEIQPELRGVAGSLERWRIVNASSSRSLAFSVATTSLHLVASDGGRLDRTKEVGGFVLVPGERAEVVVEIPSPSETVGVGDDGSGNPLMQLTSVPATEQRTPASPPDRLGGAIDVDADDVTRKRTLELGADMGSGSMMSGDSGLQFTIDGVAFDAERTDIRVDAGAVEEWTIVNDTGMDHPFHLHAWAFEVIGDGAWPGWKDTVNVPGGGAVTIRIPFVGPTGRSVYHCHILDHEDLGMMGVVDVR